MGIAFMSLLARRRPDPFNCSSNKMQLEMADFIPVPPPADFTPVAPPGELDETCMSSSIMVHFPALKTCRHTQNRKYITCRIVVRVGMMSHGHR